MSKRVLTEGELIVKDGTGSAIEFYTEEFILDDSVQNAAEARCIIQNGLLKAKLQQQTDKYPNFKNWRTCQVIAFEQADDKPEASELDQLLLRAVQLNCMPENIDNYKRPDYKIQALKRAVEQAEKRPIKQEDQDNG